jgi:hypothetical protein
MPDTFLDLPETVLRLVRSSVICEYATVSTAGVPIDTPMNLLAAEDLSTLGVATGLAYPSKAERARKNPRVGMLLEGTPDEPVISIAGRAAVQDADLQANADRYMAETAFNRLGPAPWALARQAVWYWTRIIVSITPARVLWWDNPAALDQPPHEWRAPAGTAFPVSDPEPPGKISASPKWPRQQPWQEQARRQLAGGLPAHLTLCDDEGYPLPIRTRNPQLVDGGFTFTVPKGAPWRIAGKSTLTFAGLSTFVGDVTAKNGQIYLRVERALPVLPFLSEANELWEPSPDIREMIMNRLTHEVARRGQSIPKVPDEEPALAPIAKHRQARILAGAQTAGGEHIEKARETMGG